MKKIVPFLVFALAFLFWYLLYPNHVGNQEFFSIFQTTPSIFMGRCVEPGGLAAWIGAFFSQFYRWIGVGAFLQALSAVGLYLLLRYNKAFSQLKGEEGVLALFPVVCLFFLQTGYAFLMGNTLQVLAWFGFFWGYSRMKSQPVRMFWACLGSFLSFPLFGALPAILWLVTFVIYELSQSGKSIGLVWPIIIWIGCVWGWRTYFPINDEVWRTFFPGVFEFNAAGIAWILYLWLPLRYILIWLKKVRKEHRQSLRRSWGCVAGCVVLLGFLYWGKKEFYQPQLEYVLGLQRSVVKEKWDEVLKSAQKYSGKTPAYGCSMINLALAKKGELAERALDFPQMGGKGLLQPLNNDYFSFFCNSYVYDLLGVTNEVLHWNIELSISLGDNPPPYLLKRTAELLMKLGKESAAAKYLKILVSVPFYKDWARENLTRISKVEFQRKLQLNAPYQADISGKTVVQEHSNDFFVGIHGLFYDLYQLAKLRPKDEIVRDYLLTGLLLEKDVMAFYENFCKYYPEGVLNNLPRLYREALVSIRFSNVDPDVFLKYEVKGNEQDRFRVYISRYQSLNDKQIAAQVLEKEFGNTYWYYLHFK